MDRDTAIRQLDEIQSALLADGAGKSVEKALDMAIKALERENGIKIGDECRYKASKKGHSFIVTYLDDDEGIFSALYKDGDAIAAGTLSMIERTGRRFESVVRLLEEVKQ